MLGVVVIVRNDDFIKINNGIKLKIVLSLVLIENFVMIFD